MKMRFENKARLSDLYADIETGEMVRLILKTHFHYILEKIRAPAPVLHIIIRHHNPFSILYADIETGEMVRTFSFPIDDDNFLFIDLSYEYLSIDSIFITIFTITNL
jgi:hypothetical protein